MEATGTAAQAQLQVSNAQVAAVFDEIADLLEVSGGNPFRIRAYRSAARTIEALGCSVADMQRQGEELDELRGIGKDLAGKIGEILASGRCAQLDELRRATPPGLAELLRLPGIGPRRAQRLHEVLGVDSLQALRGAAEQNRIAGVRGLGAAAQQRILEAVDQRLRRDRRHLLAEVAETVALLVARLKAVPGVQEVVPAGSLRRGRDTVGDADLLVVAASGARAIAALVEDSGVTRVLAKGTTRASVVLSTGLQVDLRVVPPASFGAAWIYFTGSKAHNIALRRIAQDRGLKLNEYGLFRGTRRVAGRTEEGVYESLGLAWIPPELREDRGEIEAARERRLPTLVEAAGLQGDLHVHHASGLGSAGLRSLVAAAQARGLKWMGITCRADADDLDRQFATVDAVGAALPGFTLLKVIEAEILEDGRLDVPPGVDLARADAVVGAIERALALDAARQTDRMLRAMDHPHFSVLAHPTHRRLPDGPACELDWGRLLAHARERGTLLQLDARPDRLDIDDPTCRRARDAGVRVSIGSEARDGAGLANLAWGVLQARRGWLEAGHVINTRSAAQLRRLLAAAGSA